MNFFWETLSLNYSSIGLVSKQRFIVKKSIRVQNVLRKKNLIKTFNNLNIPSVDIMKTVVFLVESTEEIIDIKMG